MVFAMAIVDIGWAANAFVYLFDRSARVMRADQSWMALPGFGAKVSPAADGGACTVFVGGDALLKLEQHETSWHVVVHVPGRFELEAELLPGHAPPLCAIAPIDGGVANCTQKSACLPVRGRAEIAGRRFDLEGHTAAMDHTDGLLARDTTWRWVSAARNDLALNFVQGFNGPIENVVWHGDQIYPIGAVTIDYDPVSTLNPWRIRSQNGAIDLTFQPEGERRQDKNLVVAVSRYVQPFGVFSGTVRLGTTEVPVANLVGVAEDHAARW